MSMPKANKLMILFTSPENRLWSIVSGDKNVSQAFILKNSGIASASTIANWKEGRNIGPKTAQTAFGAVSKHIAAMGDEDVGKQAKSMLDEFRSLYENPNTHVYEAAQSLGMSIEESQKLIDEAIFSRLPLFSKFYFEDERGGRELAEATFVRLGGVYYLYVERGEVWLRCMLRIRYVINIGDGLAIRCKLNVPKRKREARESTYWEYDGFLAAHSNHLFWTFEKREYTRIDFMSFVTSAGMVQNDQLCMVGRYLTTGQDKDQSIVSGEVVLCRLTDGTEQEQEEAMHARAGIIDSAADIQEIRSILTGHGLDSEDYRRATD